MSKKIVITSGKGGVGKTSVATYTSRKLAELGYKVLVVDGDFGLNNLSLTFGIEDVVGYDLSDVLDGRCRLKQALVKDENYTSLYVLPSDKLFLSCDVTSECIKATLTIVSKLFDYVIVDSPAGIDVGFERAVNCADEVLVVVTPNPSSIRDADKVISLVKSLGIEKIGVVVNRARGDLMLDKKCFSVGDIEKLLLVEVVGVIPEDDFILAESGEPLKKGTQVSKAFSMLVKNFCFDKKALFDPTKKYKGFFGSIKRSIRRNA